MEKLEWICHIFLFDNETILQWLNEILLEMRTEKNNSFKQGNFQTTQKNCELKDRYER